jgi:preprotein translocase subunit SecB
MKVSPVQLLQLYFEKVSIDTSPEHVPETLSNPLTEPFSFEDVTLNTEVGIAELGAEDGARHYRVSVQLSVLNARDESNLKQRFCPYVINIRSVGLVRVAPGAEKLASPRDLAAVNGAALVWSALREQVASVTSRMPVGAVLLPTVNFLDLRSDANKPAVEGQSVVKEVTARARKGASRRQSGNNPEKLVRG